MCSLEEAITQRDVSSALERIRTHAAGCSDANAAGVSMLLLALYYELPEVAAAIRPHLNSLTLFEAAAAGELDRVAEAIAHAPSLVNAFSPDGFTVLGLAIFFRQPKVARFLIESGADVNLSAKNPSQVAPIHAACARRDLETLKLLLARGADPDAPQQGGYTPLRAAIERGDAVLENILRDAGASAA